MRACGRAGSSLRCSGRRPSSLSLGTLPSSPCPGGAKRCGRGKESAAVCRSGGGVRLGTGGIYTADPKTDPSATFLEEVSHLEVIQKGLQAMDATAITLCMDNDLPIVMFDLMQAGNVRSILAGDAVGTLVS